MRGVEKAIRIRDPQGAAEKLISARIDCAVDLEAAQKGVHMSRFPELFEQAIDEVVIGEALLVEELAEHIAREIAARQEAVRAEVRIAARYPMRRTTPVTGLETQQMVSLIGVAAASERGVRRLVGVEATGMNACPCAQGLVRSRSAERLARGRLRRARRRAHPRARPARDAQPARARDALRRHRAARERRGSRRIVESSMSAPIAALLKRPDELFVVEHAHLRPRFVEDSVRAALAETLDRYAGLEDGDFVLSRQVNFETIHDHDVVAERHGTVGELRAELERGELPPHHTRLEEWLSPSAS